MNLGFSPEERVFVLEQAPHPTTWIPADRLSFAAEMPSGGRFEELPFCP
jgi:hypothetical protein